MQRITRRKFTGGAGAAMLLGSLPRQALAIPPFKRVNPAIKGISLSAYSLRRDMRWSQGKNTGADLEMTGFLDYCAQLGIEGAEPTAYFFQTPVQPAYINRLKRRAHLLGLDLTSGAIGNNFSHPPSSDQARSQLAYTRRWIDHYADMGVPVVRVFAGRPPQDVDADQAVQNVVANLGEALQHAEKRGVMLGMENHDFTRNVDYLLTIVDAIDSHWFGVMLDSGNLLPSPDPYAQLARLAPFAVAAQIKVKIPVQDKHTPTDFSRIVNLLRKADYGGYLVLEYEENEDPYQAIPRHVAQLQQAITGK